MEQNWSSVLLDDVARGTISTFDADRFVISGPSLSIGPRATLALSLMLHELATSTVKYGALRVPEGRVAMQWTTQDDRLHLL